MYLQLGVNAQRAARRPTGLSSPRAVFVGINDSKVRKKNLDASFRTHGKIFPIALLLFPQHSIFCAA